MKKIETPVLFILYNRADLAKKLFDTISSMYQFRSIYISVDGPKNNNIDKRKVKDVIEVANQVDFSNEVHFNIGNINQGCRTAVAGAIDWFFDNVDEGIILEDDCIPTKDFFIFTSTMLERYRDDNRIAQICGSNTLGFYDTKNTFLYSNFGSIWGWATWKRSWSLYDRDLLSFDNSAFQNNQIRKKISNNVDAWFRIKNFNDVKNGKIDTWDYQWMYTRLSNSMLSVIPKVSLVDNIGVGEHATHTFQSIDHKIEHDIELERNKIDWGNPKFPTVFFPDYLFEKLVSEKKRGFWGCGPVVCTLKLFNRILRNIKLKWRASRWEK
jgi:hypothetical protein